MTTDDFDEHDLFAAKAAVAELFMLTAEIEQLIKEIFCIEFRLDGDTAEILLSKTRSATDQLDLILRISKLRCYPDDFRDLLKDLRARYGDIKNARNSYAHALVEDLKQNVLRYRDRDGQYKRLTGETLELQKHKATKLVYDLALLSLNLVTLEVYLALMPDTEIGQVILRFRKLTEAKNATGDEPRP